MYYPDLSYYRINDYETKISIVYPQLINIGWLDSNMSYNKGDVSTDIIQKMKEIIFIHRKNLEDQRKGTFKEDTAILIHDGFTRGSAYECTFCQENKKIIIEPDGVNYYHGKDSFLLGTNEIIIPVLKKDKFYVLPTMIYHYITGHQYKPPQEFLDALSAFDLNHPFNINKICTNKIPLLIPEHEVNNFNPELDSNKYDEYHEDYDDDDDDDDDDE
jgi:hypothetical protein